MRGLLRAYFHPDALQAEVLLADLTAMIEEQFTTWWEPVAG